MITVEVGPGRLYPTIDGLFIGSNTIEVSGLIAGEANTIPHGLGYTPDKCSFRPANGNGQWGETQIPDATNIYLTIVAGGPTAFNIDCFGATK